MLNRLLQCRIESFVKRLLRKKALKVEKAFIYSHWLIWSEEGGSADDYSTEWSYGNNSVGYIGIPMRQNIELVSMRFNADTYALNAEIEVTLVDFQDTAGTTAPVIGTINITGAFDGGGKVNNAHKIITFDPPLPVPDDAVLGFRTTHQVGNISDMRIVAEFRSNPTEVITSVKLA